MKLSYLCLLLFLLTFTAYAQERKAPLEQKVKQLLDKDNTLSSYYTIDEKGISTYASPPDQLKNNIEYHIAWTELAQFKTLLREIPLHQLVQIMSEKKDKPFSPEVLSRYIKPGTVTGLSPEPQKPLNGLRVAIDPGHVAGNMEMGRIEKKFLDMQPDSTGRLAEKVQLVEGQLTLQTALLLRQSLEQAGATVMLTRSKSNETAFGKTFEEWVQADLSKTLDSLLEAKRITPNERKSLARASKRDIFRKVFFELELQQRARKINAFKPDLTVIVHYNVDEANTGWKQPTDKNFNMAFVGGSIMKNEMNTPEARLEFLRLLLTDDIETSIQLSAMAVKEFEDQLEVPAAKQSDAKYLSEACMTTSGKGVYARNLTLTRMVHGTLVYGETLYQDNIKECRALQKQDITWNGITTSSRVKQVADAYFNAIVQYAQKQH